MEINCTASLFAIWSRQRSAEYHSSSGHNFVLNSWSKAKICSCPETISIWVYSESKSL